ncbi:MAG TPA: FAD-dependent oxidoreductase [Flavobacteriales bacterium]|nr:FAD-dependent oxidoreductase [Flavobacteriales bacterium]
MESVWEAKSFGKRPHLVVIGSGIVGLFTALFHKRKHLAHRVVVVEAGPHPSGASVKNAGFACFGSPSELLADLNKEGADAMLARVEERWLGLLELRAELGEANIGFEDSGGYEVYRTNDALYPQVAEGFDSLQQLLQPIFKKPVFNWDDDAIARFGLNGIDHVVRTELEGPIDTGRMMHTLLQKVIASGVELQWNRKVTSVQEHNRCAEIVLADGSRLEAEQVLVATNGYTSALFPQLDVIPARGQVLLTSPIPGLKLKGTFHLDEGFYYFRDLGGAVLLGGGRNLDVAGETTSEDATTERIQTALEDLLRTVIIPDSDFTIERRWSGTMGFGRESKSPIIQRVSDRVGVAVRLGGMGVAIGIRVARKAIAMMEQ